MAFSSDCSRLASGFYDGRIELWNTDQAGQPIAIIQHHSKHVTEQLASVSEDGTVRIWDGRDGSTTNAIEHILSGFSHSVAFSSDLLASATRNDYTIWVRKAHCPIDTISLSSLSLPFSDMYRVRLSFPAGTSLLAIACEDDESYAPNVTVRTTTIGRVSCFSP